MKYLKGSYLAVLGLFTFVSFASAQSTLNSTADTYVRDGSYATSNFGTSSLLQLKTNTTGYVRDVYFKFDLSSVASVASAKLRVYANLSGTGSVGTSVYSVADTSWSESGMTWNNKPARGSTALASATVNSTAYTWYELDVTSYVSSEKGAGRNVISLALHNPSNSDPNININSREAAANKPVLVVTTSSNPAPTVNITSPANGATYNAPASIAINSSASDSNGTVSSVQFFAGSTSLGTDTSNPYNVTWNSVAGGSYSLTARATDNGGATTTSAPVSVRVNASSSGSGTVLIDENFDDVSDWSDLSKAVSWGSPVRQHSAFNTSGGVVSLNRSGTDDTTSFTGYSSSSHLRTFTALDRRFASAITHSAKTVTIDFRARFGALDNVNRGEAGRFMVILTYNYPSGGLDMDLDDRYNDFDIARWARPAYHLRIRNGNDAGSATLIQYGGGFTDLGEFERSGTSWWLPGFISGANGVSPDCNGCSPYPNNSWAKTSVGLANTSYRTFRYVVTPTQQEIWCDSNDNGIFESSERYATMALPQTSSAPLYRYFTTFEGIRLYWRGTGSATVGQVYVDWLKVQVSP